MGMRPNKPEHADRDYPIAGANPRLTIRRVLTNYAYPANGNVHNPTPEYRWLLLCDGQIVDSAPRKRDLVTAARDNGAAYLSEVTETPCKHEHVEQIGSTALGEMITECVRCGWSEGEETITDPAEIELIMQRTQYSEGEYDAPEHSGGSQ